MPTFLVMPTCSVRTNILRRSHCAQPVELTPLAQSERNRPVRSPITFFRDPSCRRSFLLLDPGCPDLSSNEAVCVGLKHFSLFAMGSKSVHLALALWLLNRCKRSARGNCGHCRNNPGRPLASPRRDER